MKYGLRIVAALSLAGSGTIASAATTHQPGYTGQELAPMAKVSMARARVIALNARSGKITDAELEKETGGSGLRYSFDIKQGSKTFEVGVDAATGTVLENKAEGNHPD